jgi:aconitate hydratase|tara:strand:+ start:31511 stop:33772 length:2262 start_codon:yes stop_codon:yes gene_type:complete
MFNFKMIESFYSNLDDKIHHIRSLVKKPLTLTEKILYSHLNQFPGEEFKRGESYVDFLPDRIAMQDATAQMALLQFMQAGKKEVAVPTTVHCDHLIQAKLGAKEDLDFALKSSSEVFDFLSSVSNKYGIGFWKPGAGIIHQVVLENYAFPGGMMIGTDSHTVNAGGLGMIAIGVGGADAVDVMVGMPWELKFPKLIGVNLKGKLNGWTSPKDVILKLAGILTVKGGTGCVVEYFGEGARSISCTGKGTICNMGAEIGATTSTFGYDESMNRYLKSTGRSEIADLADAVKHNLTGDKEVYENPDDYFDQVIEIDLSTLEPHINGPFTPDLATTISEMKIKSKKNNWPLDIDWALVGSCTNSSYEDLTRASSIVKDALDKSVEPISTLGINPGSEQVRYTAERDGLMDIFTQFKSTKIFTNACGPCIGQWARAGADKNEKNSIIHSFNRNFSKRADGNPNTHAFVASPEMVVAVAISGRLDFNPITDSLINKNGESVMLAEPSGLELPKNGFSVEDNGYQSPALDGSRVEVLINPSSERLQVLTPFKPWDGYVINNVKLLIKTKGKCTTDHISMAGPWLRFRGHLENISNNCLIGAVNAFNNKVNCVKNHLTGEYDEVPKIAKMYKSKGYESIVIGDHNYGEGSSREHAAMEPRFLGVKVVLVKSFARIHETNLKKQGVLALTFLNEKDYDLIMEDDIFNFPDIDRFSENKNITIKVIHVDGSSVEIIAQHTYNKNQIDWFKEGSALNKIKRNVS